MTPPHGDRPFPYRNQTPYPFCPGCGHHAILDRLNEALNELHRPDRGGSW